MRRTRLLSYLIALIALVTGSLLFVPAGPGASADTADLEIEYEAWYGRAKVEDPQVDTCGNTTETTTTVISGTTTRGCGPTSPADSPAPQSKSTGHYVVSSSGGDAGDSDGQGDTGWAAFKWDVFDYFGATAEKFEVKLHLGLDRCDSAARNTCENQGDTYHGLANETPPPIQACNILEDWSGEPGANAWEAKPKSSNACIVPKVSSTNKREFTFDVTPFADSWLAGTAFGFVIRPGTPTKTKELQPFQITFSGYYDAGTESPACTTIGVGGNPVTTVPPVTVQPPSTVPVGGTQTCTTTPPGVLPKVTFAFTPAPEDEFEDFDDFDDLGEDFSEDIDVGGDDVFEAEPDLDIIPTDIGSEELADDIPVDGGDESAAAIESGRTRPISSSDTPFPWIVLLLLPLLAIAFWSTGTALGPMGDPVSARRGGVSRVLAERQAAHRGSETRNR